ncbi:MAG: hypothetical protein SGPRY_001475 [Prymnesium sp.]
MVPCASLLVLSHAQYASFIPNGRSVGGPDGSPSLSWHALGHRSPSPLHDPHYLLAGFPRNAFGADFARAGYRWSEALCRMDSDRDGLTNGQELGDPDCLWRPGDVPQRVVNISHPGLSSLELSTWAATRQRSLHPRGKKGRLPPSLRCSANSSSVWLIGRDDIHPEWPPRAVDKRTFTDALFYYQHGVIPALICCALALSSGLCFCASATRPRRPRPPPFPRWFVVFVVYYLLFVVGVGLGVHRYFSHKAYTASKPLKLFLAFLSLFVGQGGPVDWAYVHRLHHRMCEHELDFHSPHPLHSRGFFYAQATWMITPHDHVIRAPALEKQLTGDLLSDPDLDLFHRMVGVRAINKALFGMVAPGVVLPLLYVLVTSIRQRSRAAEHRSSVCELLAAAFCFGVYYFYLPVALTWMSTGFVNSATHIWGDMPFMDSMMAGCKARNNAFLMFPMLGENWHNNHHAVPGSLSTWVTWYQVDFIFLTGRVLELLGLASDLRVEVPRTLNDPRRPPVGAPVFEWSLWALIFYATWRCRKAFSRKRMRMIIQEGSEGAPLVGSKWRLNSAVPECDD